MNKILGFLILISSLIACSSFKKTDEHTGESHLQAQTAIQDSLYRFTVSFISIGSGIDHKAHEEFIAFIKLFDTQNSVTILTEKSSWGREGESDYCMKLQELTLEQQEQFITATKDILKNSKRVRYRENSICRAGRRSDTK